MLLCYLYIKRDTTIIIFTTIQYDIDGNHVPFVYDKEFKGGDMGPDTSSPEGGVAVEEDDQFSASST